jgi:hypothetical protein
MFRSSIFSFKNHSSNHLHSAVFLEEEVVSAEEKLAKLLSEGDYSWIDEDFTDVFFELTVHKDVKEPYEGVEMIASKTYTRSVVLHIMYYKRSYFVVINDASKEQPLLDTYFPDISRRDESKKIVVGDEISCTLSSHTVCKSSSQFFFYDKAEGIFEESSLR